MLERWRRERMNRVWCFLISPLETYALRWINFKSGLKCSHIKINLAKRCGQAARGPWGLAFSGCPCSLSNGDAELRIEGSAMVHMTAAWGDPTAESGCAAGPEGWAWQIFRSLQPAGANMRLRARKRSSWANQGRSDHQLDHPQISALKVRRHPGVKGLGPRDHKR